MKTSNMPLWKNFVLHIIPGIIITGVYLLLSGIIVSPSVPRALLFYLSGMVLIPVVLIIMKLGSETGNAIDVVGYREKQPVWKIILFGVIAFIWAGLIMTAFKQINNYIQIHFFDWMSERFAIADYLINPDHYSKNMLIVTWAVGILTTSTIAPFVEEIYFRGYLLKELERYKIGAVILSALFFSLYHVFSPWLLLGRIIALLPMTFFVWKYKNVKIGIVAHIILNLVGDSLFAIPIIFGA